MAHGSFYLLGAYIGYALVSATGNFWVAVIIAPVAMGILGFIIEHWFIKFLYSKPHLNQVILTFGFAYVIGDVITWIWGGDAKSIAPPAPFTGGLEILGRTFPVYRLFVLGLGLVLALGLWLLLEKTRIGAIARAGVSDKEMISGLGIPIAAIFTGIFVFGAALAGLSGVVAAPFQSFGPGEDLRILIYALIVVVIGGLGTLSGAFWGSIVIGLTNSLGSAYLPSAATLLIYFIMVLVLLTRPTGLFSRAAT
jgi:branched-subunit amino acid ABC-type transport system permease component